MEDQATAWNVHPPLWIIVALFFQHEQVVIESERTSPQRCVISARIVHLQEPGAVQPNTPSLSNRCDFVFLPLTFDLQPSQF